MKSFVESPDRRTTIVPRHDRYGAFGSELLLLPDGRLLCSYGQIDFERQTIGKAMITSGDRGRTWSPPRIVAERPGLAKTTRPESLTRLSDGRIAMVSNRLSCREDGKERFEGFEVRWSDDGMTWSPPAPGGPEGTVPWCNHIVEVDDGDLLLTCRASSGIKPVRKAVMQYRSRDGGRTWGGPEIIAQVPHLLLTEPSTVRLRDGRLFCAIRETSYAGFPSHRIVSEDAGRTWSSPAELPLSGHELYAGQLDSGRLLIAYRHVGGYAATWAWAGDADEPTGYVPCGTVRCRTPPRLVGGALRIRPRGKGEAALYHLRSPDSSGSTVRLRAELRCVANRKHACAIHVAEAGWVSFYPERIELPDHGLSAAVAATGFHHYDIVRDAGRLEVSVDGHEALCAEHLDRGRIQHTDYADIRQDNITCFGTQSPYWGDLEAEADGESHWRSVEMAITNPNHAEHRFRWHAGAGHLPNQYEEDRMIEIENNYGGPGGFYFAGQVAWVQFPDGEIFLATGRQYIRGDGRRSSWIRGCYLREEDFGPRVSET